MRRFQATSDLEAFDALVDRFTPSALGVARRLLSDPSAAEDAVQEAFMRIVRAGDSYSCDRPFATWFYTILRNACTDMLRRRARQTELIREMAERQGPPSVGPVEIDETTQLLERLPTAERDVLELRIVMGMGFREIATALGVSTEAAKKRSQRGLRRLRKILLRKSRPHPAAPDVSDTRDL